MTLRDQFLQSLAIPREILTLTGPSGPFDVEVRGLSAGAKGEIVNAATTVTTNDDGEAVSQTDAVKLQGALLISCVFDPTSGQPLFGEADRDTLMAGNAAFVDQVFEVAARLSGLGKQANKVAEKNSDATGSSTSSSGSPAN